MNVFKNFMTIGIYSVGIIVLCLVVIKGCKKHDDTISQETNLSPEYSNITPQENDSINQLYVDLLHKSPNIRVNLFFRDFYDILLLLKDNQIPNEIIERIDFTNNTWRLKILNIEKLEEFDLVWKITFENNIIAYINSDGLYTN